MVGENGICRNAYKCRYRDRMHRNTGKETRTETQSLREAFDLEEIVDLGRIVLINFFFLFFLFFLLNFREDGLDEGKFV